MRPPDVSVILLPMNEDLRYPVGDFAGPIEQDPEQRHANISILAAFPKTSVRRPWSDRRAGRYALSRGWMDGPPVVHHVTDSHINAYVRTRRALTEDWPL